MAIRGSRDLTQPMEALAKGNRVRREGAEAKREIRAGTLSVVDAFEDPRLARESVGRVLCAQRYWGKTRTMALLGRVRPDPFGLDDKRVEDLPPRTLRRILECLQDPELDFSLDAI